MERKTNDNIILEMLKEGKTQKEIAEHFGCSPAYICKRLKKITPQPESILDKYGLTDPQKQFCIEKAKGKTSTDAVMTSYEVTSRESAKVIGSQLMNKPEIQTALNELMDYHGLTRSYRVQRLKNHIDHSDPNVSLKGLDMSFKLSGDYAPEKHQIASANININITPEIEAEMTERLRRHGLL